MNVSVRFSGLLRALAGRQSLALSLDEGATLRDLLRTLREVLPLPFVEQVVTPLEGDTGPLALALVLVNRAHLRGPSGLEHALAEGDVVAFVPPMAGG
jgi:molybdopterin converting factor small subunit